MRITEAESDTIEFFLDKLRGGEWEKEIAEWARGGHRVADLAIKVYAREMGQQDRFDTMPVSIRAYFLETIEAPLLGARSMATELLGLLDDATGSPQGAPPGWQ